MTEGEGKGCFICIKALGVFHLYRNMRDVSFVSKQGVFHICIQIGELFYLYPSIDEKPNVIISVCIMSEC